MDARKVIKTAAAFGLHRSGARGAIARMRRFAAGGRRVVVLGYHRVCADFEAEKTRSIESCLISRETFRAHVAYLAGRFELATMTRAVDVLTRRATAGRDLAVITFDDGYADVLEQAVPVLREFDAPAVMYVSSGVVEHEGFFPHDRLFSLLVAYERSEAMRARTAAFASELVGEARRLSGPVVDRAMAPRRWLYHLIRQRSPADLERCCEELRLATDVIAAPSRSARALTWDGVRALADAGFEIGAHTTSHCVLTHQGRRVVEADLTASREAIERAISRPVRHFAYCNGYYNRIVIEALQHTGYQSAVTTEDRLNRLGDDPYRVARRVMWEGAARGSSGRQSPSLLACLLDDAWTAVGFDSSEPGRRPEAPQGAQPAAERRSA